MKKYTLSDFNNFEVIGGRIQCPSGNYAAIKDFPVRCSFGEWCRFGEQCSFGEGCIYNKISIKNRFILNIHGIGNCRSISAWLSTDDVWYFQIGCRFGDEKHCRQAINEKYGADHVYHKALDLLKMMDTK